MVINVLLAQFEDTRVYNCYVHIHTHVAEEFIEGNNRRIKCLIADQITIQSSLMPYPDGYFILINQKIISKLKLKIGDSFQIKIEKDHSDYGMEMPEELATLLNQDTEGNTYFHELTPGKQRNLIYIVSQVKNTDSRLLKSLAILDHLKEASGKLDFKLLNLKIKEYNHHRKMNL